LKGDFNGGFIGIQCGFIGIQCGFYWDSIEIEWDITHKLTYFFMLLSDNVMVKYNMSHTVWNAIPIFRHAPPCWQIYGEIQDFANSQLFFAI
jgi:hypothetical protein